MYVRRDNEPEQTARLHFVSGYVCGALHWNSHELARRVMSIVDHKGQLTISWIVEPTREEKHVFIDAWNAVNEDGTDNVHETVCPQLEEQEVL